MFKSSIVLAVIVAALSAGCTTLSTDAQSSSTCLGFVASGPDANDIRQLEERGAASNVEGWTVAEATAFFAPEWIAVQPDGSQMRLDSVLSTFQDGHNRPWAERFDLIELDIRVYCDMAIVVGMAEAQPIGAPDVTLRFRYLNIWQKVNARWLYVASQSSRQVEVLAVE